MTFTAATADLVHNDVIPPTAWNQVKNDLVLAVDGRGGVYANTSQIEFSGAGGFKLSGSGTAGQVQYGSRTCTRIIQASKGHNDANFTRTNIAGEYNHWNQNNVGAAGKILFDLDDLPDGNVLNQIEISIVGATSGSFVGITMPTLSVWHILDDGTETQIGSTATDTSANNAAYTALHTITCASLGHTIDRISKSYFVKFTGATGGTAATGLVIRRLRASCIITVQSEW